MKRFLGILALLAAAAGAAEDLQKQLDGLARGDASAASAKSGALTATSYSSTYFNITFTCPPGWTIANFDSTASKVSFNAVKSGRQNVLIYVTKNASATEAFLRDSWALGLAAKATYDVSLDAPAVVSHFDTTVGNVHVSYIQLEYSLNGSTTRVYDMTSASTGTLSQFSAYATTLSDYSANFEDYDAVGEGVTPLQMTSAKSFAAKGAAGISVRGNTLLNPAGARVELLDSRGRKAGVSSEKRIDLDPSRKLYPRIQSR